MTTPKWWYYFLAVCIAMLTIAASYRLVVVPDKWQHLTNARGEIGVFNPATGETCWESDDAIDCTSFEHAKGTSRFETVVLDSALRTFVKARAAAAVARDSGPHPPYSPGNPFAPMDSDLAKIRSRR
jgi:hypothetical protein